MDYLEHKAELDALTEKVIYTGSIDAYFDFKLGTLEYCSVHFETELLDIPNFQGNAFEFGKDENGNNLPKMVISHEYFSGLAKKSTTEKGSSPGFLR